MRIRVSKELARSLRHITNVDFQKVFKSEFGEYHYQCVKQFSYDIAEKVAFIQKLEKFASEPMRAVHLEPTIDINETQMNAIWDYIDCYNKWKNNDKRTSS